MKTVSQAHASYCGITGHGCTCGVEAIVRKYREFRTAYYAACEREDAAFQRYFAKRQAGIPTNGAALAKLGNAVSYISADLYAAQGALYKLDIDPHEIDDADGVEQTPIGGDAYA